jgi:HD superfamily phosphohydrolase
MIRRFQAQQPELGITDREVQLVTIAGLCHDLGHGPYSHAFEGWVHSIGEDWKHEDMSSRLVELLMEKNELPYSKAEVKLIQALISGDVPAEYAHNGRSFLFEIVANKTNGIDVDKFDYLERDSFLCSMPVPNFKRLMMASRVMDGHVAYRHKEGVGISELFHRRYTMFKLVYCHSVGVAVELMLCDILTLANGPLGIMGRAKNIERFVYLNDTILNEIEGSSSAELAGARALLLRLRKRDLYKAVGVVTITGMDNYRRFKADLAEVTAAVAELSSTEKQPITSNDFVIHLNRINYGFDNSNPLDRVLAFRDWSDTSSSHLNVTEITAMYPANFQEVNVRCYCKNKDHKKAISKAWDMYCSNVITIKYMSSANEVEMSRQSSSASGWTREKKKFFFFAHVCLQKELRSELNPIASFKRISILTRTSKQVPQRNNVWIMNKI